ncbi:hypothetical protein [Methylobacterium nodulans]|uniref:Uncharacterized protein n=1 Tax=Methylobacterium nodulans (strain LMG 21967 / CNCM I-2342 / ORS 2060) TaxID=460265 RepID=B8IQK1_METNO|nr:hypothetical protein [Methylobacterium nodulans]ACL60513.1 hypothetical protein Mnod_5674 [Methylobacterium nodulans ORS 2060]
MKHPTFDQVQRQVEEMIADWSHQAAELRRSAEELLRDEVTAARKIIRAIRCNLTPARGSRTRGSGH